jgi:hypothetical protein
LTVGYSVPAAGQDSLLTAPRVHEHIQVRVEDKKLTFAIDGRNNYFELKADHTFVASDPIKLTYARLNPLRIQLTASVKQAPDPAFATMTTLIETLLKIPNIIQPAAGGPRAASAVDSTDVGVANCTKEVALADQYYREYEAQLFDDGVTPKSIGDGWNKAVAAIDTGFRNGQDGETSVGSGAAALQTLLDTVSDKLTKAKNKQADILAALKTNLCASARRQMESHRDNARFSTALARLTSLDKTLRDVIKLLQSDYIPEAKWINRIYYIVYSPLSPTSAQLEQVQVKALAISVTTDDPSGLAVKKDEAASGSLQVRRFSRFAPEPGAGAVIAFVPQVKYSATTNAEGKQIVGVAKREDVSVEPSVMVNFVCRCAAGPFVQPMFQIGATASKDLPGILVGGGLRLFGAGKGDVAIAGGAVFAWAKKLKTLHEGDPISGQKDIDADFGFKGLPETRPYIAILIKF